MRKSRLGLAGVAALSAGALIGGTTGTGEHVAFSPKTVTVTESDGQAVVTVARDACENAPFILGWNAPHTSTNADRGTADAGADYESAFSNARWESCAPAHGTATQVFTVPILDDDEEEEDETITMSLRAGRTSTDQTLLPEVDPDGTIVILDDDRTLLRTRDVTVTEGGVARVPLKILNGPGEPMNVDYLTEPGTASGGEDFEAFDTGFAVEDEGFVEIPVVDDGVAEGPETFRVRFSWGEEVERATVTIDDKVPVRREETPAPTQTQAQTQTTTTPPPGASPRSSSARRPCVSKRRFNLDLTGLQSAAVRVGDRPMKVTRRKNGKLTAVVDLRGNPKGRYTVKIAGRDAKGKGVAKIRRYRTCTPRRRA